MPAIRLVFELKTPAPEAILIFVTEKEKTKDNNIFMFFRFRYNCRDYFEIVQVADTIYADNHH